MNLTYTLGDVQTASAILTASAEQLLARGQALWPPESLTPERLLKHYPQETWRVAWQNNEPVGTYCLLDADSFFWPDDPAGQALYLHKLGVHPASQGRGLAQELLSHAVDQTREAGRRYLKLDTAADRRKLRALYNAFGFEDVDERQVGNFYVVRMQLGVQ